MYVIRETFVARPGQASKLAQQMKEAVAVMPLKAKTRVMTDYIGPFNTVVLETEVSDLGEFDRLMQEYPQHAAIREKLKGYTELYQSGGREIYRVVE